MQSGSLTTWQVVLGTAPDKGQGSDQVLGQGQKLMKEVA